MDNAIILVVILLVMIGVFFLCGGFFTPSKSIRPSINVNKKLVFPADNYMHPGFNEEWWYFSGQFVTEKGEKYNYNFTVYKEDDNFTTSFLVQNYKTGERNIVNVGSSQPKNSNQTSSLAINNKSTYVNYNPHDNEWQLGVNTPDLSFNVSLNLVKPYVLNGGDGYIHQGPAGLTAYYSAQSMDLKGSFRLGGDNNCITGTGSWLDRQWGNFRNDLRWTKYNWFSIRFHNGDTAMLYRFRDDDYNVLEQYKTGTYQKSTGQWKELKPNDFKATPNPQNVWSDPKSGDKFPLEWRITIPSENVDVIARVPKQLSNQFVESSATGGGYYEGAAELFDAKTNQPTGGFTFLETVGAKTIKA